MRFNAAALLVLIFAGCVKQPPAPPVSPRPVAQDYTDFPAILRPTPDTQPPFEFSHYVMWEGVEDFMTYHVLILMPGHHYSLASANRDVHLGASVGTWTIANAQLVLSPLEEEGDLKRFPVHHLDVLVWRRPIDGRGKMFDELLLVPVERKEKFLAAGPKTWTCFSRPGFTDQSFRTVPGSPTR